MMPEENTKMQTELSFQTATVLAEQLASGDLSAVELAKSLIRQYDRVEPGVRAFLHADPEDFIAQAQASDARRAKGALLGPLDGIPVSLKDVIAQRGSQLTCGSRILEHFKSPYDATVVEQLKKAGVLLWGRLNMDEFAMGSSCENSAFQVTANPWDLTRIPGGSSGGSAAAVASGSTILSLGSDTGGSIRQPAAFCGIVGLKPTYGRVSRFGLVAYASSLDQIGPMGRTVKDITQLLQVISGHDERDSTSCNVPVPDFSKGWNAQPSGWTIGVPSAKLFDGVDPEIVASVQQVIDFYQKKGCQMREIELPHMDLAVPVYYVIATAEASSNLARFDGIRYSHRSQQASDIVDLYFKSRGEGFGPEVKRRIILGTYVLSSGYYDAYYLRAQKIRTLIRRDFETAFQNVDAILMPTTPNVAFHKGDNSDDPLKMYLQDVYTIPVNLAGLPAMSVPCGRNREGMPMGFQLIGKPLDEAGLLSIAECYDREAQFGLQHPSF
jgi:aspartyl-tRNA(Asn)/glutamyl-tRNA(Gln) amidotransferase subunit A